MIIKSTRIRTTARSMTQIVRHLLDKPDENEVIHMIRGSRADVRMAFDDARDFDRKNAVAHFILAGQEKLDPRLRLPSTIFRAWYWLGPRYQTPFGSTLPVVGSIFVFCDSLMRIPDITEPSLSDGNPFGSGLAQSPTNWKSGKCL